jgi:hypothetical protein
MYNYMHNIYLIRFVLQVKKKLQSQDRKKIDTQSWTGNSWRNFTLQVLQTIQNPAWIRKYMYCSLPSAHTQEHP